MTADQCNQLLFYCLRTTLSESTRTDLNSLDDMRWQEFLDRAQWFKVLPLLYHRLTSTHHGISLPPAILETTRSAYLVMAARNVRLYQQVEQLLVRLAEQNIDIILLKGAHLAACVYDNLALRAMVDVDLLARTDDIPRINQTMLDLGYAGPPGYGGTALEHLPPYYKEHAVRMELHFNIVPPPLSTHIETAGLFERAEPIRIGKTRALALGAEDLLIHLSLHTCIHHMFDNGIVPFLDIDLTVAHYRDRLDWSRLVARAKATRADRCLYLMLSMTKRFLGTEIPDEVLTTIAPSEKGEDMVAAAIEMALKHRASVPANIARLFGGDSCQAKYRHLLQRLFPPVRTMIADDPKRKIYLLPLLYGARLRGVLQQHGKTFWKTLRRDRHMTQAVAHANRRNILKDWLEELAR